MWILDCEGDVWGGKKHWLKPGVTYTVGRPNNKDQNDTNVIIHIPIKSISRTHLTIKVDPVTKGDGLRIHSRSKVTIEPAQGTKWGTRIDRDEALAGEAKVLSSTEHFLQLGKYEHCFRIYWNPVVISFNMLSKEKKDPSIMARRQEKVEKYDIKTIATYVAGTTHVVAAKRNTSMGLQALVNGKYIVVEEYLDAIVKVSENGDGEKSLLEEDYETNWPDPIEYLPTPANEPVPRESELFKPDPNRQNMFEGWTVIFCEQIQYDSFLGPLTNGGGKLERFNLEFGSTTPLELVRFVEKSGNGGSMNAAVRFRGRGGYEEWALNLVTEATKMLGFRFVEQNEFLDMILLKDLSDMRKPLESVSDQRATEVEASVVKEDIMGPPLRRKSGEDVPMVDSEMALPPRRSRLGARKNYNMDMSDLFSMGGELLPPPSQAITTYTTMGQPHYGTSTMHTQTSRASQVAWAEQDVNSSSTQYVIEESTQVSQAASGTRRADRKHPLAIEDDEGDSNIMDELFPGVAAMKRRKLEQSQQDKEKASTPGAEEATAEVVVPEEPVKLAQKGRKGKKVDPVIAAARANLEEVEEEERKRLEDLILDDEELDKIKAMKNPGVVEVVDLSHHERAPKNRHGDEGSRWNPAWNGRPNFKKFRRRGEAGGPMRTIRGSVIIGMVEHKPSGDRIWMIGSQNSMITQSEREREETPGPLPNVDDRQSDSEDDVEETAPSMRLGATTMSRGRNGSVSSTQTIGTSSRTITPRSGGTGARAGTKRHMQNSQEGGSVVEKPVAKKAKRFLLSTNDDSESSEDELKFRFRR